MIHRERGGAGRPRSEASRIGSGRGEVAAGAASLPALAIGALPVLADLGLTAVSQAVVAVRLESATGLDRAVGPPQLDVDRPPVAAEPGHDPVHRLGRESVAGVHLAV